MPIQGLTDRNSGRLPRLGELRKGTPKKQNHRGQMVYGEDQDFFRFTAVDEPGLEKNFYETYGQQPRRIKGFLAYDTVDENFDAWMYLYRVGGLQVKCDGAQVCRERKNGAMLSYASGEGPPCKLNHPLGCYVDKRGKGHTCNPHAMLHLILPGLMRHGVVSVMTGSKIDIIKISDTLRYLAKKAERYQMLLSDLPVQITRHKQKVSTPGVDGSRRRVTKSLLRLELLPEWIANRMVAMTSYGEVLTLDSEPQKKALPEDASLVLESKIHDQMMGAESPPVVEPEILVNPEEGENGIYYLVEQAYELLVAVGMQKIVNPQVIELGQWDQDALSLCGLILKRKAGNISELGRSDLNRIIDDIEYMQAVFPSVRDNTDFLESTRESFKEKRITMEQWDFRSGVDLWMATSANPEPVPPTPGPKQKPDPDPDPEEIDSKEVEDVENVEPETEKEREKETIQAKLF